jgi:hypothetical protein
MGVPVRSQWIKRFLCQYGPIFILAGHHYWIIKSKRVLFLRIFLKNALLGQMRTTSHFGAERSLALKGDWLIWGAGFIEWFGKRAMKGPVLNLNRF